jgi:DNA mismatch endonuclease (patch repair protein)
MSSKNNRMSNVKQKDTDIEKEVRKKLWSRGVRYRVNVENVLGKPDICHKGKKIAVFIDGCFWHGCPECDEMPDSNKEFWKEKIEYNQERREEVREKLQEKNWEVIEIWGHEVRNNCAAVVDKIEEIWYQ